MAPHAPCRFNHPKSCLTHALHTCRQANQTLREHLDGAAGTRGKPTAALGPAGIPADPLRMHRVRVGCVQSSAWRGCADTDRLAGVVDDPKGEWEGIRWRTTRPPPFPVARLKNAASPPLQNPAPVDACRRRTCSGRGRARLQALRLPLPFPFDGRGRRRVSTKPPSGAPRAVREPRCVPCPSPLGLPCCRQAAPCFPCPGTSSVHTRRPLLWPYHVTALAPRISRRSPTTSPPRGCTVLQRN